MCRATFVAPLVAQWWKIDFVYLIATMQAAQYRPLYCAMGKIQQVDTQGEGAQYAPPLTVPPLYCAMGEKQRLDTQGEGAQYAPPLTAPPLYCAMGKKQRPR